jgi:hypothetical protein
VQLPLAFRDPFVLRGQQLFMAKGPVGAGNCNICHFNGSGDTVVPNLARANFNAITGVEQQVDRPVEVLLEALGLDFAPERPDRRTPPDGGFGKTGDPEQSGRGEGSLASGFGTSDFNTPTVIESADTGPFFHDNSIRTIEGAVAFYDSEAFRLSSSGRSDPTDLEPTQIEAIAAFLRALNCLENIRAARELLLELRGRGLAPARRELLLRRALGETGDALEVLAGADPYPDAQQQPERARQHMQRSRGRAAWRGPALQQALALLESTRTRILASQK